MTEPRTAAGQRVLAVTEPWNEALEGTLRYIQIMYPEACAKLVQRAVHNRLGSEKGSAAPDSASSTHDDH